MKTLYSIFFLIVLLIVAAGSVSGQVPASPQNLQAQAFPPGGVLLKWDSSSGANAYRVYKALGPGEFRSIAVLPVTMFFDWAVEPGRMYRYCVTASNGDGESAAADTIKFSIAIPPPPAVHGSARGLVTDSATGVPLEGAVVQFFKPGFELHVAAAYTDSAGAYDVKLDTGVYLVRFMKFGYLAGWFDGAHRIADATPVQILANDTTFADAGLVSLPPLHPISLSGTVRDSATGLPLPGSNVVIFRPFRAFRWVQLLSHLFGGFPHEKVFIPGLGLLHGVVGFTRADSMGHYNVVVPGSGRYIALAFNAGYIHKFFNDKLTLFDADRIALRGDTTGIDFNLVANPPGSNSLAGTVKASTGAGVPAHVVVLRLTSFGPRPVRFTMTDSIGNYEVSHLVAGKFVVHAYPISSFAPAWHVAAGCGVRDWHDADTVVVAGSVNGIDVCVDPLRNDGYCRVTGHVVQSGGNLSSVSPAQAATVYAVAADGSLAGFDLAEDDGSFEIDNLPPDTYQIVVDKEGFTAPAGAPVPLGGIVNSEYDGGEIPLTADAEVLSVRETKEVPVHFMLRQNYPNPFNPSTEIGFDVPVASSISLKVYNLIGQEISVLTYGSFGPGQYRVTWNGVDGNGGPAGSGVYFVKLLAVPVSGDEKFSQVIKVILLK